MIAVTALKATEQWSGAAEEAEIIHVIGSDLQQQVSDVNLLLPKVLELLIKEIYSGQVYSGSFLTPPFVLHINNNKQTLDKVSGGSIQWELTASKVQE